MMTQSNTVRACLAAMTVMAATAGWRASWAGGAEPASSLVAGAEDMTFLPPVEEQNGGELLASEPFLSAPNRPWLSARLGAVLLQRSRPHSELFVYDPNTGKRFVDPHNMVFPFNGGVDAGLLVRGTVADVGIRYFGVEQFTGVTGPVTVPAGAVFIFEPSEPLTDPVTVRLNGSSSLQSAEVNLRRNVGPRFTVLAGLRYLSFRDALAVFASEGGDPLQKMVTLGTRNQLFGVQIGADGILWSPGPRFRIEGAIKAGVYANGVLATISGFDEETGESFRFPFGADRTSFVGDLNFVGVYQLNARWAVRAGYQLLWLGSVATGSMISHGVSFEDEVAPVVITSATVFFHGALVGLERTW